MKKLLNILTGSKTLPQVQPHLPPGTRIYTIGDIHGRADLLQQLHTTIENDAASYTGKKQLIYLGDYIDRGENSKQVIDLLLEHPLPDFDKIYLRGNHEQTMLDFLAEPEVGKSWFIYGGLATLVSYKVTVKKLPTKKEDFGDIQRQLKERVPHSHIHFMENTGISYEAGSYYFVHAGIKPEQTLEHQQPEDQLWICDNFVSYTKPHEKIIIHGHTITDEPDARPNRIGIDTGAYITGKLTCLILENDTQRILQTNA